MHGGSAHNGLTQYNGSAAYNGSSADVGGLNNLNELWVGWNDPKAGL